MQQHNLSTTFVHAGRQKRFSQGSVNPVYSELLHYYLTVLKIKNTLLNVEQKANYFMAEEGR